MSQPCGIDGLVDRRSTAIGECGAADCVGGRGRDVAGGTESPICRLSMPGLRVSGGVDAFN